jgi:hypothetical protein
VSIVRTTDKGVPVPSAVQTKNLEELNGNNIITQTAHIPEIQIHCLLKRTEELNNTTIRSSLLFFYYKLSVGVTVSRLQHVTTTTVHCDRSNCAYRDRCKFINKLPVSSNVRADVQS